VRPVGVGPPLGHRPVTNITSCRSVLHFVAWSPGIHGRDRAQWGYRGGGGGLCVSVTVSYDGATSIIIILGAFAKSQKKNPLSVAIAGSLSGRREQLGFRRTNFSEILFRAVY
jgi:hypothetical protein